MGLLDIFRKKDPWVSFDFSTLKTDIHSHLIPGIDDGSDSVETSIELIQGLISLGYSGAVTTPHIMSDYYRNSPENIRQGLRYLDKELINRGIDFKIKVAAEYYIDYEFISSIEKTELLTFGDNYILVEFSFAEPPVSTNDAFFALQTNGYKPVLAHPERYHYWHRNTKIFSELYDRGINLQVNLLSLMGVYGEETAKVGETLIRNGIVDWLGTDLHHINHMKLLKEYRIKKSLVNIIYNQTLKNKIVI